MPLKAIHPTDAVQVLFNLAHGKEDDSGNTVLLASLITLETV